MTMRKITQSELTGIKPTDWNKGNFPKDKRFWYLGLKDTFLGLLRWDAENENWMDVYDDFPFASDDDLEGGYWIPEEMIKLPK